MVLPQITDDSWRNKFHLEAPVGWINDPNGLCFFKGEYHVFYQYSPLDPNGGLKFWGHYTSKDLVNWTEHKIALFPDIDADKSGVYSGSALIHNDEMYLFYTGNVKHEGDHDYVLTGREHNTIMVKSSDGYNFSEKKILLRNEDYPSNMSLHVRDPKVWKENDAFYMVLGARTTDDLGAVLLYKSTDLENWDYVSTPAKSTDDSVYMWECPDLLTVNHQRIFISSPQGMNPVEHRFNNVYQSGYSTAELSDDYQTLTLGEFDELDCGFDFYAPQTFEAPDGRIIMIGWMGVPDAVDHLNPTVKHGYQHALTLPRELRFVDGKLYQTPVVELQSLRKNKVHTNLTLNGPATLKLNKNNCFELDLKTSCTEFNITLREDVIIDYTDGTFNLTLGVSGYGRDIRSCKIESLTNLQIFSDTSCLEIYLNNGEKVFTTRCYDKVLNPNITFTGNCNIDVTAWDLV